MTVATSKRTAPSVTPKGQDEVRAAVLRAARDLFSSMPYGDVKTRQIAQAAGVNLGLLHHYFGSKEAVVRAVIEQDAQLHRDLLQSCSSPQEALLSLFGDRSDQQSVRLMAYMVMSNLPVGDYVVRDGLLSLLLASALADKEAGGSTEPADLVAAFSLFMGWTLFGDFIVEAIGGRIPRQQLEQRMLEVSSRLTGARRPAPKKPASAKRPAAKRIK